jgi:N-acetyl-gamma-glutamyl-phosphate reductase
MSVSPRLSLSPSASVLIGLCSLLLTSFSTTDAFIPVAGYRFGLRRGSSEGMAWVLGAKPKVFIDGEAGTTGLQVRERLSSRDDLQILSIDDDKRKDEAERKRLINEADAVILCTYQRV